jgi:hypothetical protein
MKPSLCPACQSDQLTHIDMRGDFWLGFLRLARSYHLACLECGAVSIYLDDATVAALRSRRAKPTRAKA